MVASSSGVEEQVSSSGGLLNSRPPLPIRSSMETSSNPVPIRSSNSGMETSSNPVVMHPMHPSSSGRGARTGATNSGAPATGILVGVGAPLKVEVLILL